MTGAELRTSGIESDRSTNLVTTTFQPKHRMFAHPFRTGPLTLSLAQPKPLDKFVNAFYRNLRL